MVEYYPYFTPEFTHQLTRSQKVDTCITDKSQWTDVSFTTSLLKVNVFFSLILDVISPKDEMFSQSDTACMMSFHFGCFSSVFRFFGCDLQQQSTSSYCPSSFQWSTVTRWDVTFEQNQRSMQHINWKGIRDTSSRQTLILLFPSGNSSQLQLQCRGGEPNIREYIWVEMQENVTINRRKTIPGTLKGVWWEHAASRSASEHLILLYRWVSPQELSIYFLIFQIVWAFKESLLWTHRCSDSNTEVPPYLRLRKDTAVCVWRNNNAG